MERVSNKLFHRARNQSEVPTGVSRSDRPMLQYISVRTRSATPLTRALSAGEPACAKWFVPEVKAPGTMMDVSMPQRFPGEAP